MAESIRSVLRGRVYYALRDTSHNFITEAMVNDYLNEGYLDLVARLRLADKEATGAVGSDGTIAYPTDYLEPISLWISTYLPVEVSNDNFDSYKVPGTYPDRIIYRHFNSKIETYPATTTATKTYTLRYTYRPAIMDDDADKADLIPTSMENRLIDYAIARAWLVDGDQGMADTFMRMYETGLPDRPRGMYRDGKGPAQMTPMPDPFESDYC
jgi:hypothetical protein